jgi:hypothetical protein
MHLYEFAHGFYDRNMENAIFLRAERQTYGKRAFKFSEDKPLQTSYGKDVHYEVIGKDN